MAKITIDIDDKLDLRSLEVFGSPESREEFLKVLLLNETYTLLVAQVSAQENQGVKQAEQTRDANIAVQVTAIKDELGFPKSALLVAAGLADPVDLPV